MERAGRHGNRVTLARALSKLGVLSRTQARAAILAGRVAVDGQEERDPDRWVDPDRGNLTLDGLRAHKQAAVHFALHKPAGVMTTRADELGRRTIYELLPEATPWVFPVGRLDLDSSGLLLLTNDSQLGETLTGPESNLAKVYEVTLDAPLAEAMVARFRAGMTLADGTALQAVEVHFADANDRARVLLSLREGKNRQIRRMAEDCGLEVLRLHRVAVGPVRLGDLAEGDIRPLNSVEGEALRELVQQRRAARGRQRCIEPCPAHMSAGLRAAVARFWHIVGMHAADDEPDYATQVRDDVARFGCHISVLTDTGGVPVCAFTVGLVTTYGHPEIVVFGLELATAEELFEALEEELEAGGRFAPGQKYDNLVRNYPCVFKPVAQGNLALFEAATQFHGDTDFAMLQLFWPDKQGRFPWEPGVREGHREGQPVLERPLAQG